MDAKLQDVLRKYVMNNELSIPLSPEVRIPLEIVAKYDADPSFLIPMLQDVQEEFNYLPQEALNTIGGALGIAPSQIFSVCTFYKAFSLTPQGRHKLSLCVGTACHVRGANQLKDHIELILHVKPGETSADMEFTFETVNCLGACALGPVLVSDGEYNGNMNVSKLNRVMKAFKIGTKVLKKQRRES
jgi:NADH-quinone oxidoreductase subunit E